ncbi:acyltransferase family protein [Noviherbaspirillum galbum]|uniref:acyltransferase family protein n=1 Tax=Noviherbaspirillum galbum TaxID=2709383 RepID=UPI002E2C2B6E|nr:acyltransferase [Noviherbaspirillum galbum]
MPPSSNHSSVRPEASAPFGLINLLKAGAAQLMVLHHLAFYGPMADQVRPELPGLIGWLGNEARIAVQLFLVIGGFLAAKSLAPKGWASLPFQPLRTILRRYLKLAPPFIVAMLVAVAASALAGRWMHHGSISAPPQLLQLISHALLLHGVFEVESLSAGAWYVAIDFQLYTAFCLLLCVCAGVGSQRSRALAGFALVTLCATMSLLHFNRQPDLDNWALYFFGSYGLGVLAWWAGDPERSPMGATCLRLAILLPALLALMIDFRSRIAVALITAFVLSLYGRVRLPSRGMASTVVNRLGNLSYAQFLIHFPVSLLINAYFTRFLPASPLVQGLGMLLAWGASLGAGAAFHHWVEQPLNRLFSAPRPARAAAGVGRYREG